MILSRIHYLKFLLSKWPDLDWKVSQKLAFFVFFVLALAFFLHFREVRVDHLEPGSIAKKYVVAQVGFEFADLETTRMLREESLRDIGFIYYFEDEDILKGESQIHNEVIQDPLWREQFPSLTFEDLMKASDSIRETLLNAEFTDVRTIQKLALMGITSSKFLPCIESIAGLTADKREREGFLGHIWQQIEKTTFPLSTGQAAHFMLEKYRRYPWNLKEDFNLRYILRRKIKENTPIKLVRVEAGSRIINAGDKVTPRHEYMLHQMKKVLTEEKHLLKPLTIFGSIVFSLILTLLGLVYIHRFYPSTIRSPSKIGLIALVIVLTLSIAKVTEYFIAHLPGYFIDMCRLPIYLLFPSIILSILIDRTAALAVSGFIAIILGITLAMESHDFLILNLSAAVAGIIWTKMVRTRKEIFIICSKVWLCTIPMILALNLLENQFWKRPFFNDCLAACVFIFLVAVLIVIILPLLESTFGIVTDMRLMESGDPNRALLRRLSLEASGTYQHALSVATLAEEAALAIGANALLCRVGALYHDVGKIIQPNYFTENLRDGFNMHQLLTPLESAQVIIQHVTEGIKLAENANLPQSVIDIIREHHGTTLVYYFYHAQMEQSRAPTLGLEEGFFRYPGPTPQTRESAIVMLSDSIEASFRCQSVADEKVISDIIETIIAEKIQEHQLDASGLTFGDLEAIKKAIFRSLLAISHHRPTYPTKHPKIVNRFQEITL